MADVSVEFGAKDTGLEATLRSVQSDLEALRSEMENTAMSTDEATSALRRMRQLEGIESQLQTMADATRDVGDASVDSAGMVDDATDSMHNVGDAATDAGERSEMGFGQMAAAVATGQLAVEVAMGAIKAAIEGVSAMFDTFGDAIDLGGKLDILSTRTGVASGELARLGRALQNTGMEADMIGPIFDRFNKAIAEVSDGSGEAGEALAKLGIPIERLKALSPDEQFRVIGEALGKVADRSERADMAMDIFGRGSGTRLLRLFENFEGTMARVDQQLGAYPTIMNQLSSAFENAGTEINAVREKFNEFATGLISKFLPAVEAIAMGLASFDAAAFGEKIGAALAGATNAMNGFKAAMDAIKVGEFGLAFDVVFESIVLQVKTTGNEIIKIMGAAFKTIGDMLMDIFRPSGPTMLLITSTFDWLANYIKEKVAGAMADMFASMGPAFSGMSEGLKEHADAGAFAAEAAFLRMQAAAELAADDVKTVLGDAPLYFKENLENANGEFFNTEGHVARINELTNQIAEAQSKITDEIENTNENLITTTGQTSVVQTQFEKMMRAMSITEAASGSIMTGLNKMKKPAENVKGELGGASTNAQSLNEYVTNMKEAKLKMNTKDFNAKFKQVRNDLDYLLGDLLGTRLDSVNLTALANKFGIVTKAFDDPTIKLEQLNRMLEALQNADAAEIQVIVDGIGSAESKIRAIGDLMREQFTGIDATPLLDREKINNSAMGLRELLENSLGEFKPKVTPETDQSQLQEILNQIQSEVETAFAEPMQLNLKGDNGAEQAKSEVDGEFADPISLALNPDVDSTRNAIDSNFETPISLGLDASESIRGIDADLTALNPTTNLDATESINAIRKAIAEPIEVNLTPSGGAGGGGGPSLSDVVNELKAIKDKLPMQALA